MKILKEERTFYTMNMVMVKMHNDLYLLKKKDAKIPETPSIEEGAAGYFVQGQEFQKEQNSSQVRQLIFNNFSQLLGFTELDVLHVIW